MMSSALRGAAFLFITIFGYAAAPPSARAQDARLIQGPTYGVIRSVHGDVRPVAAPRAECAQAATLIAGGPCFDQVVAQMRANGRSEALIVGLAAAFRAGESVAVGAQGAALYRVSSEGGVFRAEPVSAVASNVRVPRECFSLPGEPVRYRLTANGGAQVAQEYQVVSCGGGPRNANGPFVPEGAPLTGAGESWPPTSEQGIVGASRALAIPDPACAPEHVVRDVYCASGAIQLLAGRDEMDLIASRNAVAAGAALAPAQIEQLVLKQRRNGYKADRRWANRSMLEIPQGCVANSDLVFRVVTEAGALMAQETVRALCGAPRAPRPQAIYETYGRYFPIAREGEPCAQEAILLARTCFSDVIVYMRANTVGSMQALVLKSPANVGDRLYSGGPIRFDFAETRTMPDGTYQADRQRSYTPGTRHLPGCSTLGSTPNEASGVILVYANGALVGRAYQWYGCPQ